MENDLLRNARRQAEKADPSLHAAALLRIARAESGAEPARARQTLLEALDAVRNVVPKLSPQAREPLIDESRSVAAAVSPDLLAEISTTPHGPEHFGPHRIVQSMRIIQTMLAHGHIDAAFNYLLEYHEPASFPYGAVGGVLHHLNRPSPEEANRRLILLRHAAALWQQGPAGNHLLGRDHFVRLFGHSWKEFPAEEASAIAHQIVDRAAEEPDTGTSSRYPNGIHFTSKRQSTLFLLLHVLRHLDPVLAQSLVDSPNQLAELAAAARRYPNGLETMREEAEAEAERRKAEGATCEGGICGYVLSGDPRDFDRQRRIIDAVRAGDFAPSIEDALDKYRQDISPDTPNYAPKEFWPSTGAFRSTLYQAGKRFGSEAARLLEQIPEDDLRLFASIELAAALAGVPEPTVVQMKQPNPPHSRRSASRLTASENSALEDIGGSTMRSPDGRLIRCPKCNFHPPSSCRWTCKCGHSWNTFWTSGLCPACHYQWEVTQCPGCGETSNHQAWYAQES